MQDLFNFTKSSYLDIYHDTITPANDPRVKGFFVCLMVKPDLNINFDFNLVKNLTNPLGYSHIDQLNKLFKGMINPYIISNLTQSAGNYFSQIISNKVESVSYPDVGSNSEDVLVTLDKNIFKLPVTETGVSGMSFSLRLRENEAHDVLRMMTVWHKYIHAVTRGNISPKQEYLDYNIIDYKGSMYVIHLKPDFRTITMWSKYTGIYPSSIPVSTLSEDISQIEDVTLNVEFSYDKFEVLNEDLLREINLLTSGEVISRLSMQQPNGAAYLKSKNPLIYKIENSPFYQFDLNGLKLFIGSPTIPVCDQAASLFGNRAGDEKNMLFAAPLTTEMIDVSTGYSISKSNRNARYNMYTTKRF